MTYDVTIRYSGVTGFRFSVPDDGAPDDTSKWIITAPEATAPAKAERIALGLFYRTLAGNLTPLPTVDITVKALPAEWDQYLQKEKPE